MSPRVTPKKRTNAKAMNRQDERRNPETSSYGRFREREERSRLTAKDDGALARLEGWAASARHWWPHAIQASAIGPEEQRVLSKGSSAAGGYLVPTDMYTEITAIARAQGMVASLAKEIITDGGGPFLLPTATAHGTGVWTAENASYSVSDETFGQLPLAAYKVISAVIVSEELLLDSAPDLGSYLSEEFGGRLGALENTAFVLGNGSGKPTGFLANITAVTAPTGNATTFRYDDIVSLLHAVPVAYRSPVGARPTLAFIASDSAVQALRLIRDTAGQPILFEDADADDTPLSMLGYPLFVDPDMPAVGASNRSIAFGDWGKGYVIRRVKGVSAQRLINTEIYAGNGQVAFLIHERVDGNVLIADALRALQHSAS